MREPDAVKYRAVFQTGGHARASYAGVSQRERGFMLRKKILIIAVFLMSLSCYSIAYAQSVAPSNDEIQAWWKQHSKEKMTIDGSPVPIGLSSKEKAFLVPVYFIARGRNDMDHTILVRPAVKAVREVAYPVSRDVVAHDLDHDGISEVETIALGSGQGRRLGTSFYSIGEGNLLM